MKLNYLSSKVIQAAINIHKELGPGLLESVYQACMVIELKNMGTKVKPEVPLPIYYRGQRVHEEGFRIDLLVEDVIIVELKSVEKVRNVHKKQLLTYLRLAKKPLGLLINFNEALLKHGITRIINTSYAGIQKNSVGSECPSPVARIRAPTFYGLIMSMMYHLNTRTEKNQSERSISLQEGIARYAGAKSRLRKDFEVW